MSARGSVSDVRLWRATETSGVLARDVCYQDSAKLISTAEMRRKTIVHKVRPW